MKVLNKVKRYFNPEVNYAIKWSFIGQISTRFINVLTGVFLARMMFPEQYGVYTYIIGTLILISNLTGLSLRTTSARNIAFLKETSQLQYEKYLKITFVIAFILSSIGALTTCLLIGFANMGSFDQLEVSVLYFCSLAVFSEIYYGLVLGILSGVEEFKLINIQAIVFAFLKFLFTISGYSLFGMNGAIVGWVSVSILSLITGVIVIKSFLSENWLYFSKINLKDCKTEAKLFFSITIPISIEASLILFVMWGGQTLFLNEKAIGKEQLGIFNVAYQWKSIALYLPAIFINLLQPFFSKLESQNVKDKINFLFNKTKKIVFIVSISIFLFFLLFGKILISFYGERYEESYLVLMILMFSTIVTGISNLYRELLISKAKVWNVAFYNLFFSLVLISVFLILRRQTSLSIAYAYAITSGEIILFGLYMYNNRFLNK